MRRTPAALPVPPILSGRPLRADSQSGPKACLIPMVGHFHRVSPACPWEFWDVSAHIIRWSDRTIPALVGHRKVSCWPGSRFPRNFTVFTISSCLNRQRNQGVTGCRLTLAKFTSKPLSRNPDVDTVVRRSPAVDFVSETGNPSIQPSLAAY